ncbi:MAG: HAD hydrolase-like protein [Chloroflexota bacterium]|nr:HAD hydrolase-like protein [Chloroflexota bacterium]
MVNIGRKQPHKVPFEIINNKFPRGKIRFAIFDFDGTISLIREGWQQVMIPMMVEILMDTPNHESIETIREVVRTYVANTTGKQTIYQMIRMVEEIKKRGGQPAPPLVYKDQYHHRLMRRIITRLEGLRNRSILPVEMVVPGALETLSEITHADVKCFLASGTDEKYVIDEANLLGIMPFFDRVYGAQDDYKNYSKKMVIQKIIQDNNLSGPELIAFGDGYVEIENTKEVGGITIGLATNESERSGIDLWKRDRLIASGADVIMADFLTFSDLWKFLTLEE